MEADSIKAKVVRGQLSSAQRIVVKVSSNIVATSGGVINRELLEKLVGEISGFAQQGREVLLVTSGAVRIGLAKMGLIGGPPADLSTRQAAAAVGQVDLIAAYKELFGATGHTIGQLLLTGDDITDRRRYLHTRNTLLPLMHRYKVIPIINENDSVSVEGVQIGENDRLAALIAGKVQCDLLILLSDVEGLYTANPSLDPSATLIHHVREIHADIERIAGESISGVGRGGMRAKIAAVKIATRMGANTVIASGRNPHVLTRLINGEELGTLFIAKNLTRPGARKQWLGFAASPRGTLIVDKGAARALTVCGSSLLPIGVIGIDGHFHSGDVVLVTDMESHEIARGLVNYSSEEMHKIAGKHTAQIEKILGYHPYDEAIHRDNLLLF